MTLAAVDQGSDRDKTVIKNSSRGTTILLAFSRLEPWRLRYWRGNNIAGAAT